MFNKLNPMQCQQTAVKVEEEAAHISVVDFASSVGLVLRYHLSLIHNISQHRGGAAVHTAFSSLLWIREEFMWAKKYGMYHNAVVSQCTSEVRSHNKYVNAEWSVSVWQFIQQPVKTTSV